MAEYYAVERSPEYLAHYGVKGMRWGVRRDRPHGGGKYIRKMKRDLTLLNEHEYNTLRDVIAQRRTIDGNSTAEEADAQENLMGQVAARLNVVVEKYPELKANENYATAMEAVDRYTNMVRTSKMVFNDTATKYNKLIRQIPDSIVASLFGFKVRDYLKIEDKKADMPSLKI